jgi:hypothetical protein
MFLLAVDGCESCRARTRQKVKPRDSGASASLDDCLGLQTRNQESEVRAHRGGYALDSHFVGSNASITHGFALRDEVFCELPAAYLVYHHDSCANDIAGGSKSPAFSG